jgi:cellulose synthase/poly-beta-1,6-N-acetylglucosamine synthase-like glycosyltransferase
MAAAAIAYIYFGYPIILTVLAKFSKKRVPVSSAAPTATLLISAFNEIAVIKEKIENSLALDYPAGLLTIVVVSDGSDDGTDDVVRSFSNRGVRLIRQEPRRGKTSGLNLGVAQAISEVLIFSDANAIYHPMAASNLTRHFTDPNVGYVVGNARYYEKKSDSAASRSEGLYWRLETFLKKQESRAGSVVGGDGAIYAIRRELYEPLLPTDINDFLNPLQIISKGYIGVFDPEAVCYEEAAGSFGQEYRRKVRIISRSLTAIGRVPRILNPFHNSRHWFFLVSHKLLRWFAPILLITLFGSSCLLATIPFYRVLIVFQAVFYLAAMAGLKWSSNLPRFISLPFYFCMVNLASFHGCLNCLRGEISGQWTPPRQGMPSGT